MTLLELIKNSISAALIIIIAILVGALASRHINRLQQKKRLPETLIFPLRFILRYGLLLVTFMLVMGAFQVNIGNFWNFISAVVGLIAIGFVAVWSILSNVSAAFLLMIFKPFKIGDRVEMVGDAINGEIHDMNFMFTVIRDPKGNMLNVPNNTFFQKTSRRFIAEENAVTGARGNGGDKEEVKDIDHSQANLAGTHLDQSQSRNR